MIRILVIEDDSKMRNGLVELLSEEGYEVDSAENGQKGLEAARRADYDIVLTDLIMPSVSGMDVLREMKRAKPKTHVILITAFATVENAVEAMKNGASDYITKPFKVDEVQTKIRKVITESEFEHPIQFLDSDIIKAISNPIRKDVVKLLNREGHLRFTDIKNRLQINDPTKLSFHLRILRSYGIVEQDEEKVYSLTNTGMRLLKSLTPSGN